MISVAAVAVLALAGSSERALPAFRRGVVDGDPVADAIVTRASQEALDAYRRQHDRKSPLEAVAVFDVATGVIRIDFRGGTLPARDGAELEDLQEFVSNGALEAMRPIVPAAGTKFFYNGRDFAEQYPEDVLEDRGVPRTRQGSLGRRISPLVLRKFRNRRQ